MIIVSKQYLAFEYFYDKYYFKLSIQLSIYFITAFNFKVIITHIIAIQLSSV